MRDKLLDLVYGIVTIFLMIFVIGCFGLLALFYPLVAFFVIVTGWILAMGLMLGSEMRQWIEYKWKTYRKVND